MTEQTPTSPSPEPTPFIDDPAMVRKLFLVAAGLEALSWIGLLTGMYLKRVAETTDLGVQIFGPIHGVIFLFYVAMSIVAFTRFKWSVKTLVLALVCSIPPFFSVVFEVVADRKGLLAAPSGAEPSTR